MYDYERNWCSEIREIIQEEKNIIDLATGDPQAPLPDFVAQAAAEAIHEGHTARTPIAGDPQLKKALSDFAGYQQSDLLITNGGQAALSIVLKAILRQGDKVALASPFRLPLSSVIKEQNAFPFFIETKENNFQLDISLLEKLEDLSDEPFRALIINSPNDPTGAVINRREMSSIAAWAREKNIFLISDEIYRDFFYEGNDPPASLFFSGVADYHYGREITVSSFSNSYNIPGLRLGYILAHPRRIEQFACVAEAEYGCPSSLAQRIGLAFLKSYEGRTYSQKLRYSFSQSREMLLAWLDKKGIPYVRPEGGFYVFPDFKEIIEKEGFVDAEFLAKAFLNNGVAVIPGSGFGYCKTYKFYLRIAFACQAETMREGIKRMDKVLSHKRKINKKAKSRIYKFLVNLHYKRL